MVFQGCFSGGWFGGFSLCFSGRFWRLFRLGFSFLVLGLAWFLIGSDFLVLIGRFLGLFRQVQHRFFSNHFLNTGCSAAIFFRTFFHPEYGCYEECLTSIRPGYFFKHWINEVGTFDHAIANGLLTYNKSGNLEIKIPDSDRFINTYASNLGNCNPLIDMQSDIDDFTITNGTSPATYYSMLEFLMQQVF